MLNLSQMKNELLNQGFVVYRKAVDPSAIDRHWEAFGPKADILDAERLGPFGAPDYPLRLAEHRNRRKEFYETDRTHLPLAFSPALVQFAQHMFDAEPVLRLFGTHQRSLKTPLHTDALFSTSPDPIEKEFKVWCALEDIHEASGPVYFYPTSHKTVAGPARDELIEEFPELHDVFNGQRSAWTHKMSWGECLTAKLYKGVRELGLPRVVPTLDKGDVILFMPTIVHGTLNPEEPERSRRCALFYLYGEGAPFYEARTFFGAHRDLRRPENAVCFRTERTEFGVRVVGYGEILEAQSRKAIVA
jgi:hypothetical protein